MWVIAGIAVGVITYLPIAILFWRYRQVKEKVKKHDESLERLKDVTDDYLSVYVKQEKKWKTTKMRLITLEKLTGILVKTKSIGLEDLVENRDIVRWLTQLANTQTQDWLKALSKFYESTGAVVIWRGAHRFDVYEYKKR